MQRANLMPLQITGQEQLFHEPTDVRLAHFRAALFDSEAAFGRLGTESYLVFLSIELGSQSHGTVAHLLPLCILHMYTLQDEAEHMRLVAVQPRQQIG